MTHTLSTAITIRGMVCSVRVRRDVIGVRLVNDILLGLCLALARLSTILWIADGGLEGREMAKVEEFKETEDGWAEAFGYCREEDHPVVILMDGHKWKLFPSGHCKDLG